MIQVIDKGNYFEIYSDLQKKILERPSGTLWNATEEEPIAVSIVRYNKGDYVESIRDIEIGENEDAIDEVE